MARKHIFDNLMRESAPETAEDGESASGFRKFGAARSISSSIDELARQASKLAEGETVIEIDPDLVDRSFVPDRMSVDEDDAYHELLEAVRERGQDTPILVRPHPSAEGRYMAVFGHRRVRVAKQLGRPVRAVVKTLADIDHVVAQGQENSARANLTFIERVMFAQQLGGLGFSRETIQSALSVDYQTLSKMLTIPKAIPAVIIDAIGPAKGIGRDRWLDLRKLVENPKNTPIANSYVASEEFAAADSDERFNLLFDFLNGAKSNKAIRKGLAPRINRTWAPADKSVAATIKNNGKAFSLALKAKDAAEFGEYISENLDSLYEAFRTSKKEATGD
ncbi:MAG: plasmid partitioning protein RepB [Mesorhizobium sp.]|uniref:plasmid partitioning protein RepB n=1 Tax=Mesorhizobium sp. TaxID=1871066 RepID=UPI000FE71FEE|nr:plasmid partitioning protein RepB [Mesorhizobium sp.]RWE74195.1 MAG: plasmid partitioning protein RepB [Mesorhizobium sp.]TJW58466.1 MAG: plasmid partitioning protein RepB [Mesorhizobium sp.]